MEAVTVTTNDREHLEGFLGDELLIGPVQVSVVGPARSHARGIEMEQLRIEGGRPFLLYMDGVLMGDADFRNLAGVTGESRVGIRMQSSRRWRASIRRPMVRASPRAPSR